MLKRTFFLLLVLVGFGFGKVTAQNGDPCDPVSVNQVIDALLSDGFDCLEGAGPFQCVGDVFEYISENCPPVIDTTHSDPCDPAVVNQLVTDLIDEGFDCLEGAGPFQCVDDVFDYAFENCPLPVDTTGGNLCDSALVNTVLTDLIAQGHDCLEGAGPFACVYDVFNYAIANCPGGDPTGGNSCDSTSVANMVEALISSGFNCLEGAGPFACTDDVLEFAFEHCPPPIDTTGGDLCDSALVNTVLTDLIAQGHDCLEGAGPFACVYDVFNYAIANCPGGDPTGGNSCDSTVVANMVEALISSGFNCLEGAGPFACTNDVLDFAFENCPPSIDTTGGYPCDSASVSQVIAGLISDGFTCLEGAGSFDCVDDVFEYAIANCPPSMDTTLCDSAMVSTLVTDLIAQGYDCLEGAGPFNCVHNVFEYAFENCSLIDTTGGDLCDSAAVSQAMADLIAQGYDCLEGAGPFDCLHDVLCYALENCPLPNDTSTWGEFPPCLQNIPLSVNTFQQFLQYISTNCDSTMSGDIPACWLTAPTFATDEEFFAWIFENCPDTDSLIIGEQNRLMQAFYSPTTSAAKTPAGDLTGLAISPNPTTFDVEIRLKEGHIARVELIDLTGRTVFVQHYEGASRVRINLTDLSSGVYMARVADAEGRIGTQKVVKTQ